MSFDVSRICAARRQRHLCRFRLSCDVGPQGRTIGRDVVGVILTEKKVGSPVFTVFSTAVEVPSDTFVE
jgi:hypothetical protein